MSSRETRSGRGGRSPGSARGGKGATPATTGSRGRGDGLVPQVLSMSGSPAVPSSPGGRRSTLRVDVESFTPGGTAIPASNVGASVSASGGVLEADL